MVKKRQREQEKRQERTDQVFVAIRKQTPTIRRALKIVVVSLATDQISTVRMGFDYEFLPLIFVVIGTPGLALPIILDVFSAVGIALENDGPTEDRRNPWVRCFFWQ